MATAQMEEDQEETESEEEPGEDGGAAAATAATPDACVALRLVAAAAWFVVQERRVQEFPRVLALLAAVGEAAPDLVHYRHLAKLRLGLQAKVIMSMLEEKQSEGKIYDAIDTFFPEGEMPSHPHATPQDLKLVQVAQENFRDLVLGLLSDPKHREKYVQEHLENDYGECFLRVVEELFHDYLWQLESTLPEPHFEQLLEAAYIRGPSQPPQPDSSILSRYLSVMREQPAGVPMQPPSPVLPNFSCPRRERQKATQKTPRPCTPQLRPARNCLTPDLEEHQLRRQDWETAGDVVLDSSSEGSRSPFQEVRKKRKRFPQSSGDRASRRASTGSWHSFREGEGEMVEQTFSLGSSS